jgi:hypothetical protein
MSLARASMRRSRSPKDSATGSMRSYGRVGAPRGGDVAARQRGVQGPGARRQRAGLALEEGAVAVDASPQLGVEGRASARAGHRQRRALVRGAAAAQRVAPRLQRQ